MTKKDFIAIAQILSVTRPKEKDFTEIELGSMVYRIAYAQWEKDYFAIDAFLVATHPRFDKIKFRQAVYGLQIWG